MSIKQRPGFKVNVAKTVKSTKGKSLFYDIKPGESVNVRFLPSSDEKDNKLFFESSQHFNFKQEGNNRAWACLNVHGDGSEACPVCELVEAAEKRPETFKSEKTVEAILEDNASSQNWHAQVLVLPKDKTELPEQISIVRLSKATAAKISAILAVASDNGMPTIDDPDNGEVLNIARNTKSGKATRYEVVQTGLRPTVDSLYPNWVEEFVILEEALGLRVVSREEIIESIRETYSNNVVNLVFPDEA